METHHPKWAWTLKDGIGQFRTEKGSISRRAKFEQLTPKRTARGKLEKLLFRSLKVYNKPLKPQKVSGYMTIFAYSVFLNCKIRVAGTFSPLGVKLQELNVPKF